MPETNKSWLDGGGSKSDFAQRAAAKSTVIKMVSEHENESSTFYIGAPKRLI